MDLRTPIGLLFTVVGVLLLGFGLTHRSSEYTPLGININLAWGGVMLAFGVVMLILASAAQRKGKIEGPPIG